MEAGREAREARWARFEFGSETAKYFREKIQAAWFAYWLKDEGQLPFQEAMTFETGTNQWETYAEWPPRQGIQRAQALFPSGRRPFL